MKNLIFAIVNPEQTQSTPNKLRELTISWSRYGYHGDLIEAPTIDQALLSAAQTSANFCLLQSVGHVIDEQWYLPHKGREGFYRGIQRLIDEEDFLIAGEWFSSESACLGLDTDCLLVNLNRYRALIYPKFGYADFQVRRLPALQASDAKSKPSAASSKADLLPTTTYLREMVTDTAGWHLLSISLQQQLTVPRFGPAINFCRFNLAKDAQENGFCALLGQSVEKIEQARGLSSAQETFLGRIQRQLADAKKGVFLLNIEPYTDLQMAAPLAAIFSRPLDAVFSVAAGFKPYKILQVQGFHAQTKVVLFDYSLQALAVRRFIVEHWDGYDFPNFVRKIFATFPAPESFYQLWFEASPENLDWQDFDLLWQQELEKWDGAQAFAAHWQACRQLPHEYLHCDLLQNRQSLLAALGQYQHAYIWWSNAFFTIFSHWHYSAQQRKQQYLAWVAELAAHAPHCLVNGADHNNVAVNGLTAAAYAGQFNQHIDDELKPQHLHAIDIHF